MHSASSPTSPHALGHRVEHVSTPCSTIGITIRSSSASTATCRAESSRWACCSARRCCFGRARSGKATARIASARHGRARGLVRAPSRSCSGRGLSGHHFMVLLPSRTRAGARPRVACRSAPRHGVARAWTVRAAVRRAGRAQRGRPGQGSRCACTKCAARAFTPMRSTSWRSTSMRTRASPSSTFPTGACSCRSPSSPAAGSASTPSHPSTRRGAGCARGRDVALVRHHRRPRCADRGVAAQAALGLARRRDAVSRRATARSCSSSRPFAGSATHRAAANS